MKALLQGKKEWEYWQEQELRSWIQFLQLIVRRVIAATGIFLSVSLFVVFTLVRAMISITIWLMKQDRPRIQKAPGVFVERDQEYSEPYSHELNYPCLRR